MDSVVRRYLKPCIFRVTRCSVDTAGLCYPAASRRRYLPPAAFITNFDYWKSNAIKLVHAVACLFILHNEVRNILNDAQKIQYLRRVFAAVDGLWFMKIEEDLGFDKALYLDNEVWKVMPKIQARFFQSVSGLDKGIEALEPCLKEKLLIDGFTFSVETGNNSFSVTVTQCPWYDLLVKSGRANLSRKIGDMICNTEHSGFAQEFGENISFELKRQICRGSGSCILHFSEP